MLAVMQLQQQLSSRQPKEHWSNHCSRHNWPAASELTELYLQILVWRRNYEVADQDVNIKLCVTRHALTARTIFIFTYSVG